MRIFTRQRFIIGSIPGMAGIALGGHELSVSDFSTLDELPKFVFILTNFMTGDHRTDLGAPRSNADIKSLRSP